MGGHWLNPTLVIDCDTTWKARPCPIGTFAAVLDLKARSSSSLLDRLMAQGFG